MRRFHFQIILPQTTENNHTQHHTSLLVLHNCSARSPSSALQ